MRKKVCTFITIFLIPYLIFSSSFKGIVLEKVTSKPLIGVNITIVGTLKGTTTRSNGEFILELDRGCHDVRFSLVGYENFMLKLCNDSLSETPLIVYMVEQPFELKGVLIVANTDNKNFPSNYQLTERSIKNVPAFVESDAMRSIAILPGIVNYNDFKAAISIRGSSPDQTQVLFDGMEIYYPWHLLGSLGSFNIQTIKKVDVFTGGYPAKFGSRAGGIIDIKSKEFTRKKNLNFNISLLSASIFYNNRLTNLEILFAARKTYLDLLSQFFYRIPYGYVDSNLKLRYFYNEQWNFELLGYLNNDFFTTSMDKINNSDNIKFNISDFMKNFIKGEYNWGNRNLGFKTNYQANGFKSQLFINLNKFTMNFPKLIDNELNEIVLSYEGSYLLSPQLLLNLGIKYKNVTTKYFWNSNDNNLIDFYPALKTPTDFEEKNIFYIAYSDLNWIYNKIDLKLGLRFTHTNVFNYLEPRISFKYNFSDYHNLFLSAGTYSQFLTTPLENQEFTIAAPLVFADKPIRVNNYSLGSEQNLSSLINSRIEFYYKVTRNLPLDVNNTLNNLGTGEANSFGFDIFITKSEGYLTWQLAYSFLESEAKYNSAIFPLDWEITHNLNTLIGLNISEGWYSNFGIVYHSGLPYTPITSSYYGINKKIKTFGNSFIYGARNSQNYPNYLRFDFSLSKKYTYESLDLVLNLQIINFLYRENIINVNWEDYYFSDFYYDSSGNKIRDGLKKGLPILPSIGVELHFK